MANLPKSFIPDTEVGEVGTPTSFISDASRKIKEPTLNTQDVSQVSEGIKRRGATGILGFGVGVGKGALETLQNIGQATIAAPALIPGGKKFGERLKEVREETGLRPETLEARGRAEKVGKFAERVAEFAVPATKVAQVTKGASFLTRLVSRAVTSGAVATGQAGEIGKETAIAAGTEAILPAFKPVFSVVRRLFKGLGSGLSGVSTDVIDTIVQNPQTAREVSGQLAVKGNFKILEKNAQTIVKGAFKVRQQARKAFGEGLEKLREVDIPAKQFRASIQKFLDGVGSSLKEGERKLTKVEFSNPKNIKKATGLIDELSNLKLDGVSLRTFKSKVANSAFKTTGGDVERLSFNAFLKDFGKSVDDAISASTDKLDDINKAFSKDMQLVEGIERIFGKVKFKSLAEIDKVAQKLEQLFSQKGLNPRQIDDFLKRIDVDPEQFRTREAIRQITTKVPSGANRPGLTFAELTQQITGAVVTPTVVKNISIATGLSEQILKPLLEKVAPTARASLIKLLIESQK